MRLLLLFCLCSSLFGWELRRKEAEKTKKHRIRSFIQTGNLESLPKLSRLPQLSKAKSLHVPEKSAFDPCATSQSVCLNGGTCLNKDGAFLCQCPSTHYGKKCEFLADMTKCAGNKCQNGAACVSLPRSIQLIDPELQANHTKAKKNGTLTQAELQKMIITISYECICTPGYVGLLCDMLEKELECQEDYCMGRGTANYNNGTCTCDCHQNFLGPRCETENPCKDYECFNSGVCRPVLNLKNQTVEAVCDCPQIQMIKATISGEQCETLFVDDAELKKELMPCRNNSSVAKWYGVAQKWMLTAFHLPGHSEAAKILRQMTSRCIDNKGKACNPKEMTAVTCFHSGTCQSRVVTLVPGVSVLMPYCQCVGADTGLFCEFERMDECDPTLEEKDGGITRATRCTDEDHGSCVITPLGEAKCHCKAGYVGEMCETYDPCADKPCFNSECIPIPSETVIEMDGEIKQTYRCLCSMGDEMTGPNNCIFSGTGNCTSRDQCGEGQCITCDHSEEEEMLQLCTAQQIQDGFRCICKPGFELPYCKKLADPCESHMCENGAICQPTTKYNYDCKCLLGTRGSLCEEVTDICLAFGESHCIHGICYEDPSALRGFSCNCDYGHFGRDCQFQMGSIDLWKKILWDEYYWIAMPLFSAAGMMLFLAVLYFLSGRKRSEKEKVSVKSSEEKSSTKKSSV